MKRVASDSFSPDPGAARVQHAALCWRLRDGETQVLLVTSRDTGRWVIPKGWPVAGLDGARSAAREAWEEAGVRGRVDPRPLGVYTYNKVLDRSDSEHVTLPCVVSVFGLAVDRRAKTFPEKGQRRRRWFARDEAASMVDEPDLQTLIVGFVPPGAAPQQEASAGVP